MPRSRPLRLVFLALLPLGLAVLVLLAMTALREAWRLGEAEAWLMAWSLLFLVGLPASLFFLAVAGTWQVRRRPRGFLPNSEWIVPGAGR